MEDDFDAGSVVRVGAGDDAWAGRVGQVKSVSGGEAVIEVAGRYVVKVALGRLSLLRRAS